MTLTDRLSLDMHSMRQKDVLATTEGVLPTVEVLRVFMEAFAHFPTSVRYLFLLSSSSSS